MGLIKVYVIDDRFSIGGQFDFEYNLLFKDEVRRGDIFIEDI